MQEKIKKITMIISLTVAGLIAICAILFAVNQKKFGVMFDVAFWVLLAYIGLSLLIWLFYGVLSLKNKVTKTIVFVAAIAVVVVAAVLLSLGDTMPVDFLTRYKTSDATAKFVSIACNVTYITVIGAAVLVIGSIIFNKAKK